jgi:hypothetical protein
MKRVCRNEVIYTHPVTSTRGVLWNKQPWRHGGHQCSTHELEDKTSHQKVLLAVHSARRPVVDVGKLLITEITASVPDTES